MMDIKDQLKGIMEVLLEHKINDTQSICRDCEELWDSLKHIEIMVTLEEEFGVRIPHDDISNLNTFDEIVDEILKLKKL